MKENKTDQLDQSDQPDLPDQSDPDQSDPDLPVPPDPAAKDHLVFEWIGGYGGKGGLSINLRSPDLDDRIRSLEDWIRSPVETDRREIVKLDRRIASIGSETFKYRNSVEARLSKIEAIIDGETGSLESLFDQVQIEQLKGIMVNGHNTLSKRIDGIEEQLSSLTESKAWQATVSGIMSRLSKLEDRVDHNRTDVTIIERDKLPSLDDRIEDTEGNIDTLEERLSKLERDTTVEADLSGVDFGEIRDRLGAVEQYDRVVHSRLNRIEKEIGIKVPVGDPTQPPPIVERVVEQLQERPEGNHGLAIVELQGKIRAVEGEARYLRSTQDRILSDRDGLFERRLDPVTMSKRIAALEGRIGAVNFSRVSNLERDLSKRIADLAETVSIRSGQLSSLGETVSDQARMIERLQGQIGSLVGEESIRDQILDRVIDGSAPVSSLRDKVERLDRLITPSVGREVLRLRRDLGDGSVRETAVGPVAVHPFDEKLFPSVGEDRPYPYPGPSPSAARLREEIRQQREAAAENTDTEPQESPEEGSEFELCPDCSLFLGAAPVGRELVCNGCGLRLIRAWSDEGQVAFWDPVPISSGKPFPVEPWIGTDEETSSAPDKPIENYQAPMIRELSEDDVDRLREHASDKDAARSFTVQAAEIRIGNEVVSKLPGSVVPTIPSPEPDGDELRGVNLSRGKQTIATVKILKPSSPPEPSGPKPLHASSRACPKCQRQLYMVPRGSFRCYHCRAAFEWKGGYWLIRDNGAGRDDQGPWFVRR